MKQIIHKTLSIAIIAFFSQAAMAIDVTSTFTTGATLTVLTGKNLVVQGALTIQ